MSDAAGRYVDGCGGYDAGGDKVSFIWQTYNRESGKWENSRTDTPENQNTTTFHSKYSFDIPADDKESYVDMGVRCIAEYDNFSVTSDVVTIRYIDRKPEPDPEPEEPPEDPDEPTGLAISDYDGLVAFAKRVNEGENTLDAYLTNNITVPDGSQWTVGIGTEFKSYNGTFNGRGYGINGLQLNISDNGGLFGIIGKKGVVRDLAIVGSSSQSVPTYSGGIAAINYGTIDHCVSGVNLAKPEEGLRNSTVNGTISGGITAQNKGIITGCRSAAVVNGVCCGGIAGMNDGRIYGCASNGPVGTGTTECAGGIAGENDGSIQSSYISGAVSCKSEDGVKGWIAGKNSSENVDYVLYPTSDDTQAFGSSSAQTGENISDIADSDMKKQLFVKIMNEITDDTVTWVQAQYGDTCLNMGYPTIRGNYLKQRTLSLQNGISVSGMMHSDLQVILEELAAESDAYKAFASKGNVLSAYSVRIVDSHGNRVSSDLWSSGGYQLHIPTNGKSIALFAHNTKGELVTVTASFGFADGVGARLAGHTLSLEGDIGVNFYMELDETIAADPGAYMHFSIPSGSQTLDQNVMVQDAKRDGKYYIFKCNVAAKEMQSVIGAQIVSGEPVGKRYEYSVQQYADYLLGHVDENEIYAKAAPLVMAMLTYGEHARTFFDESVTAVDAAVFDSVIPESDCTVTGIGDSLFYGATLSLKSTTTLSLYFKSSQPLTISCAGCSPEIVSSGSEYVVRIRDIASGELDQTFTVTVSDGTGSGSVIYSPLTYCYRAASSDDQKLVNTVKALYQFFLAARDYFA